MIANAVTLSRLVLAACFAAMLGWWFRPGPLSLAAAVVLSLVAIAEEMTDLFDGVLARRLGTTSALGAILDPLVDALARLTIYFALALAGFITIAVPLVMAGRDIIVAYTRVVRASTGGPASARLSGKVKAIIQGGGIPVAVVLAYLAGGGQGGAVGAVRAVGEGVLIAVTAWSLGDYLRGAAPGIRRLHARSGQQQGG